MHEAGEAVCERLARYSAAVYTASTNTCPQMPRSLGDGLDSCAGLATHLLYCWASPMPLFTT